MEEAATILWYEEKIDYLPIPNVELQPVLFFIFIVIKNDYTMEYAYVIALLKIRSI